MKILVTGASGFIGRQFCQYYNSQFEITALVRNPADFNITGVNVCNYDGHYDSIYKALDGIDVVIHLATYYVAEHQEKDVLPLVNANITFGTLLLEAMAEQGINKFLNIGTTWQKFEGDYRYANLYAATKQAFQEIVNWYSDAKGFSVLNLHLNDTYGEEDSRKKIIQLLIETAQSGKCLDMSLGEQRFETCYITDVLNALKVSLKYLKCFENHQNETYSILTGQDCSLKDLVKKVQEIMALPINIKWGVRPYRDREVMKPPYEHYSVLPNWSPKVSLENGLKKMIRKKNKE